MLGLAGPSNRASSSRAHDGGLGISAEVHHASKSEHIDNTGLSIADASRRFQKSTRVDGSAAGELRKQLNH